MVKRNLEQQIQRLEESIAKQKEQLENLTLIFRPPAKIKEIENRRQEEINKLVTEIDSLKQKKNFLEKRYENLKLIGLVNENSWLYRKVLRYIGMNTIKLLIFEEILLLFIILLAVKVLGTNSIVNNRFGFIDYFEDEFVNAFIEWVLVESAILTGFHFLFTIGYLKWVNSEKVLKILSIILSVLFIIMLFMFMVLMML